ncbi:MAG: tetratricopeptide repeat protein [Polyangiaceae bacterium]|nr:tetratricopeptide repeat protein [Polyangiaceae bacterium]
MLPRIDECSPARAARLLLVGVTLLLATFGIPGCMAGGQVERLVDGRSQMGGFIDERAYAYYARGRVLELEHSYAEALTYYQLAQEYDPDSVELAVRVGTTLCQLRNSAAFPSFESAKHLDPRYAPLFTELSRCYLLEGDRSEAFAAATKAISLDPNGVGPNQQMLTVLRAENDHLRLSAWYRSLLAQEALDPWKVRQLEYLAASDEQLLAELWLHSKKASRSSAESTKLSDRGLLGALTSGNDTAFLERSRALNLSDERVIGLLARSGKLALATQLAERRYSDSPRDADTWVQLLWLTTLNGDEARFDGLLAAAPTGTTGLSPESRTLLSSILASKAGVISASEPLPATGSTLRAQQGRSPSEKAEPQVGPAMQPGEQR